MSSSADTPAPIGMAVVGTTQPALHHLESAALHSGLRPVAAVVDSGSSSRAEAIPGCPFVPLDDVISNDDVSLVVVSGELREILEPGLRALSAGRHLLIDPSASPPADTIGQLSDCASDNRVSLTVWRPHAVDANWRQALHVARSAEAGPIRSARFLLHDLAVSMMSGAADTSRFPELTHGVLATTGPHYVSQLLSLIETSVVRVRGRLSHTRLGFGTHAPAEHSGDTAFTAWIEFSCGASAVIEVDLACAAPLATGWVVQCERGGFADGQHSITVEDGEIYQVPVEVEPIDIRDELVATIRNWDDESVRNKAHAGATREGRVARVIELLKQSYELQSDVECEA